jgi:hypothetical protein
MFKANNLHYEEQIWYFFELMHIWLSQRILKVAFNDAKRYDVLFLKCFCNLAVLEEPQVEVIKKLI